MRRFCGRDSVNVHPVSATLEHCTRRLAFDHFVVVISGGGYTRLHETAASAAVENHRECNNMKSLIAGLLLFGFAGVVNAACQCRCVNGQVEAICQSAIDLKPICSPTICPIAPPSVRPVGPPTVPPVGTSQCHNQQVWDPNLGQYVWQRLCN